MKSEKGIAFSFTKASLAALPVPQNGVRETYRDTKARGLHVRVTSAGAKTFSLYRRMKGGSPERITLGRFPEMSIEQARRRCAELNAKIEGSENPAEARRALKGEMTFSQLFDAYLTKHAKVRKRTWDEDEEKFENHLRRPLGGKKLSVITRDDVRRIHRNMTESGHPTGANRVLALLSAIFNWGIAQEINVHNPAKGIARNPEVSRDRFLSGEELPRFFEALSNEQNETFRDYFMILLLSGARRSNVAEMRWEEINFDKMVWRIPLTKNGTPQFVSIDDSRNVMMDILLRRKAVSSSDWKRARRVDPGLGVICIEI